MAIRLPGFPLLLALLTAAPGLAQPPGFELERRELRTELAAGTLLEIDNAFGDVRARFGGHQGVVEVRAVFQQFAGEGPRLELASAATPGGWQIAAGFREGEAWFAEKPAGQKKRVDLVVFVPAGVNLRVKTGDGLIEARGLHGDFEARSRGGDLQARAIRGDLRLESESGSLLVVPENHGRKAPQRLASARGAIDLYLREDGHFRVHGQTRGLVSADYSLDLRDDGELKKLEAVVGKGFTPIEIAGGTGKLHLIRKPSAATARREDP